MRNAVEDNQSSGQQEHFEILPMFSTRDKGMRMTVLRPGRRVGRAAPLLPWLLTAMVLWAMTGTVLFGTLLGLAPTPAIGTLLGHPVAVGAAVVLLFAAIIATTGLYSRAAGQFGQRSAAGLFAMLAVTGGLAADAGVLLLWMRIMDSSRPFDFKTIATSPTVPPELGAIAGAGFALLAAIVLLRLSGSVAHARRRQTDIERLRMEGLSFAGTLTTRRFTNSWLYSFPMFKVEIGYIVDGMPRVFSAHMLTSADRVPIVGSRMLVLTDDRGTSHVELDPSNGAEFEPDVNKYAASHD